LLLWKKEKNNMSKTLKITLIVIGSIVAGSFLLLAGIFIGRSALLTAGAWPGGMMDGFSNSPSGMMGGGMMGGYGGSPSGMMGGGMMGNGMMGDFTSGGLSGTEPTWEPLPQVLRLTLEQAEGAVGKYLSGLNNQDLVIGEVMVFDNHAYAQIIEKSTGVGAFEVLVDPVTLAVYPEYGPNMMWNLKYGMMAGFGGSGMMGSGMMGGMMGGFASPRGSAVPEVSAEMPVAPEEAVESAQRYLEAYFPGTQVEGSPDPFYGYYTLHILRDNEVVGMLSVSGYTGQVFPHTWHGDFLEMSGD
jgi:hypothetical protein